VIGSAQHYKAVARIKHSWVIAFVALGSCLDSIEMSDVKVQDLGSVAVVTGRVVETGRFKTNDLSGVYRFTDIWAKRNGRWQIVAGHETKGADAVNRNTAESGKAVLDLKP